ncbi:hypothetical protein GUJ93_ZPchr0013g36311 [Zizania palustris]|uniref:Uncharacterized protein n=1 Tax=Zizania palustris TaxID=103762 RepID=A0A8J5X0H2_ZIZPA|nr:hypothetical protein GUJ93_ZPchr0013g36311 [Zizania palustris]
MRQSEHQPWGSNSREEDEAGQLYEMVRITSSQSQGGECGRGRTQVLSGFSCRCDQLAAESGSREDITHQICTRKQISCEN